MKNNSTFIDKHKKLLSPPPRVVVQSRTVHHYHKAPSTTISTQQKQSINRDFLKKMRDEAVEPHTTAIYASNISLNEYRKLRIRQHCEYRQNKPKKHVGRIGSYNFDRRIATQYLYDISGGSLNLEQKMVGKWAAMARRAALTNKTNREQVSLLNKVYVPGVCE